MNRLEQFSIVVCLLQVPCGFAHGITIETVAVGNVGNADDPQTGVGGVASPYRIGKYEVTNAQYVEFLNAVDPQGSNALNLWPDEVGNEFWREIDRSPAMPFGAKYSYRTGRGLFPVVEVDWFDAIRFTNWLHNGAVAGSGTENGAYTIGPPGEFGYPSNASNIARNPGAIWFLPNDDEWYKSAYHENDGATANYFDFPTSSDLAPSSDQPPGASAPNPSNSANFFRNDGIANGYDDGYASTGSAILDTTTNYRTFVGAYASSHGPYGTLDQAGNVWEWTETSIDAFARGARGGSWSSFDANEMSKSYRIDHWTPATRDGGLGFRVATVPEPSAFVLIVTASLIAAGERRVRVLTHPSRSPRSQSSRF